MKKLYFALIAALVLSANTGFGQVVNEGFEESGSLPTGWTNSIISGSYNFVVTNTSLSNPVVSAHGGSYWAGMNCWSASSGSSSILVTAPIDWSGRAGVATSMTVWVYRDLAYCGTHNDRIQMWVNTAPNLTGAVSLGVVPRRGDFAISGSVTGSSTVGTSGWYQYTFPIPTTYNSNTNYIIFNGLSTFGASVYIDDVQYTAFPCVPPVGGAITGNSPVCMGATRTLANATGTAGGTWTSSAGGVASVNPSTGVVTSVSPGTTTITYSATACSITATATTVVTVIATPSAISGSLAFCPGGSATLTNGVSGGTWSSSASGTVSVGASTGVVTAGSTTGNATITYDLGNGCPAATAVATVNALPAAIGGTPVVCVGATTTLSDATSGGTFTSGNTGIATVGSSSGVLTGVSGGNPVITYTTPTGIGCFVTKTATVNSVAPITGGLSVCIGTTLGLSDATSGGLFSSSNTAITTINPTSGVANGVALGAATITYTSSSTGCFVTSPLNVINSPTVYSITGSGAYCAGGSGIVLGLNNSGTGVAYTLFYGATRIVPDVTGPVGGGAISFPAQTGAGSYNVIAAYGSACATNMSGTATISINPLPTAFVVTGGGLYCSGGTGVAVGLASSTIGINYQLYLGSTPIGSPVVGTSGAISFGLQTTAGTYTVIATNATTLCQQTMSGSATVGINALPTAFSLSGGGGYCLGGTGSVVGLSGSTIGTTYQLFVGGTPVGSPVLGTGTSFNFGSQTTAGTYTVIATNTATGCTNSMSGTSSVSVNPLPFAYTVTGGGAYCLGGTGVAVGLNGSASGISYQLMNGITPVGSPQPGTGVTINFGLQTTTGSYTVVATNTTTTCVSNMFGSASVSTNPLPSVFSVTGGGSYCAGGSGVVVGLAGSAAGVSYQLFNGATLIGAASGIGGPISFGLQTAAGTYTVVATNTTTLCTSNMSGSVTVVINPLPTVFTVTGGGSLCAGGTGVAIGLSGSTSGVGYQLFNGTTPVGTVVPGTGSAISFGPQTGAGAYTVTAINSSTTCTNNMAGSALVLINALPSIYSVTGGGSYCTGGTGVLIGLSASNVGFNYQLYNTAGAVGTAVAGTGTAISFGSQTVASPRDSVIATNTSTGCSVLMSGNVPVIINALPTPFTVSGGGSYCAGGTGVAINLGSSVTGTNYQLFNGGVATGAPQSGTGLGLSFGSQTASGTYTVVASNGITGCTNNMLGSASVAINPVPAVFTVSGGGTYCTGTGGVHVTLSSSVSGINYQLYNGLTTSGPPVPGNGLALDLGAQTAPGSYTVVAITPVTFCQSNMSGSVNVLVNPLPTAFTITGGGGYCTGGTGVHVGLGGSSVGVSYQLKIGATPVGGPVSGTGSAIDFGLETGGGSYSVVATNTATGCTATMTGFASVVVNTLPVAHAITGGGNYCPGGTGAIVGITGSNSGISYQLYNAATPVGVPMAGTGLPVSFGSQIATGSYTVLATNTSTSCASTMPGSVSVGLNPLPIAYNVTGGGNYCSGGTGVIVGLNSSETGVSYQLLDGSAPMGAPISGTGAALNFGPQTTAGNYIVMATNGTTGCSNNMTGSVTVSINPLPAAHNVTGGGNYCIGGTGVHVGVDGSAVGTNYQLMLGGSTPVGAAVAGSGSTIDFGNETAPGIYTIIATNTATTCSNAMTGSVEVGLNALPAAFTVTGGGTYCAGGAGLPIMLSGSDVAATYQLFQGSTAIGGPVGGTGSSLNFGVQTATGTYTIVATDAVNACTATMTGTVNINTGSLPVAYNVTGGGNYCDGGAGVHVSLSNSAAGVLYQLFADSSPLTSMVGTGSALDFGPQYAAGVYTVVGVNAASCSNNMTGSATVGINPVPDMHVVSSSSSNYCAGGIGVAISIDNSDPGINYQLYNGPLAIGGPVMGIGSMMSFGYVTLNGTYTVKATNTVTGCMATMAPPVSVTISPLPTVYTVTGGGQYCNGGSGAHIGLSGSNAGIEYMLYQSGSSTPAGIISGTGAAIDFGLVTTAGSYTVVGQNTATTCSNNMTGLATIAVNPLPAPFIVSAGSNYCSGGAGVAVTLSGSSLGVSYQLMNGSVASGAAINGTGTSISFGMKTTPGIYSVVATNIITGCTATMTGTSTIGVNPAPVAYPVTGGGNFCPGGGVHVGLGSSAAGVTYQLYNGATSVGFPVPGVAGTSLDFGIVSAGGTYTVMGSDDVTGCPATMSGAVHVGVNPLPVAYTVVGGGSYCAGAEGVHIGLSGSAVGVNYTLYSGPGGTITLATVAGTGGPLDFGLQTMAGAYTAMAINTATGCSNTMTSGVSVNINPVVTPLVSVATGGSDTVCSGNIVTFTATTVNGGTTPAYQWTVNGAVASNGSTYNYAPANGDVVAVTLTSSAACAMPSTATSSVLMTVESKEAPAVSITSDAGTEVCQGTLVTFTPSATFGGTAPVYTWVKNGVSTVSSTLSYTPADGDVVYAVLTSNYRCRLSNTATSNHIVMKVDAPVLPVVTITANPGNNVAAGQTVTLIASVVNGGPAPAYQWLVNGVPVGGATNAVLSNVFSDGDSVTCQVLSSGGCQGLLGFNSITIHVANVGVKPVVAGTGSVMLVPNPNKGSFTVKGQVNTPDGRVAVEVVNMLGQVLYNQKVNVINGEINEHVQLSGSLANGMYILNLRSATDNQVFHFVIEQ